MAVENVGGISYEVSLELGKMIEGQRRVDAELKRTAGSLDQFGAKLNVVAAAVKVYVAAQALMRVVQLADDMRLLAARVQVAAGSIAAGADAMRALVDISRRTQTSVTANAEVFARLNQSLLAMGGTQRDTLQLTELLGKAIKVSGASATESGAAMLQFGQALGSGKLAGDELRSLLENAPYLMRQLADGIGVPIGQLKSLGEQGKLTADVVVNALSKAAAQIDKDFEQLPQTFQAAFTVAGDAATAAAGKMDELLGISAALAGIAQGVGKVFDALALSLGAVAGESGNLARNNAIKTWADGTVTVLSYVADGADLVIRTFKALGLSIAGAAAAAKEFFAGNVAGSVAITKQNQEDLQAIRAPQLAGAALRDKMASGQVSVGAPGGPLSKLRAPAGTTAAGASNARKGATSDPLGSMEEAFQKRLEDWWERNQNALDRAEEKAAADIAAKQKQGREIAIDMKIGDDPIARLQLELQTKSQMLAEAAALDQANAELYAQAAVALEQQTAQRIREIREDQVARQQQVQAMQLQGYASLFESLAGMTQTFAGKQNAAYKVLFSASKAFAIAESIIKIQQGIAQAASLPFPLNLGAMATVAASTAGIVSTIAGTNYGGGRQYGGPANVGSMYRVNETGAPEMFMGPGGKQYMMPTTSGQVVPADQAGGRSAPNVTINNHAGAAVTTSYDAKRDELIIDLAVQKVASQIANNDGQVWNAMRGSTSVGPRLS